MPATFLCDSQLIDESLLTAGIPALSGSPSPVGVFMNPNNQSEFLAIHQDGELYHVRREPLSKSGWNANGIGAGFGYAAIIDDNTFWGLNGKDSNAPWNENILWKSSSGTWVTVNLNFGPFSLSNGWDGTIWCGYLPTTMTTGVQQFSNGQWQDLPGAQKYDIRCVGGSASAVWIGDQNGNVILLGGASYSLSSAPIAYVTTAPNGTVWAVDLFGTLYENSSGSFQSSTQFNFWWVQADAQNRVWVAYQEGFDNQPVILAWQQAGDSQWTQVPAPPGDSPAVSVSGNGTLLALNDEGIWTLAFGAASWQRHIMPTGLHGSSNSVTEVVTGQDTQQNWHAFYVQSGSVCHTEMSDGSWGGGASLCLGSSLGVTNHQQTGELITYGITSDGNFVVFRESNKFAAQEYQATGQLGVLQNCSVSLSVVDDQHWVVTAVRQQKTIAAYGSSENPLLPPGQSGLFPDFWPMLNGGDPNDPGPPAQQVIRLPYTQLNALPYGAILDTSGNIWMTYNMAFGIDGYLVVSQADYVQISGSGISAFDTAVAVSALLDSTNSLRIYATDSNGVIWLLRQTGTTGDSSNFRFVWSQWHPLGSDSLFLANGPGTLATTELFSVSSDNTIYVLSQNATTQRWTADQVKRPSGAAEDLDSLRLYKTVVNLQDENQQPLANSQVTITAEEPVTLWVEGVQYELDAGDSVPGFTNNMGKLRVSSVASTLHTSQLTFSSSLVSDPLVVYPPGNVKAYLAGQQTPPNRPTFTSNGAALTNAVDSNGDPYAPFSSLATNSNVPAASQAIMQIGSATPTNNSLQSPVLQAVSLPGEPSSFSSFWDDLWNDLVNYAEDFFFALRNGVIKVLNATYDAVNSTITLIVQVVGDAVQRTINFIVQTYHDIANALHSAFLWLETAVEDVIDWLKSLFDWKAIRYTQQVIEYYIGQSYSWLQSQIMQGQALAANFFASQENTVQQGFQWLQQQLTGTVDQSAQSPSITSSVSFKGLNFAPGILTLGSDVNWLLEKVENFLFGGSGGSLNPVNSLVDPVNTFFQDAAPAWQSLSTALQDLQNLMQDLKSPSDFKNKAVSDLLGTFENIILAILEFADALTQALLVFASEALQNIDAAFTQNVDIPLVSYLYQKITGQGLSAQNLFTLLFAAPLTIGYKLAGGGRWLFSEQQVNEITSGNGGALKAGAPDPALLSTFAFCAAGVNMIWAVFDTILDGFDESPALALQILDLIAPFVLQIFEWPSGVPFSEIPLDTSYQKWSFGNWIIEWVPIPLNLAMLLIGNTTSSVARYSDPLGKGVLTGIGCLNLVVGAVASSLSSPTSTTTIVSNVFSPFSNIFQFLRLSSVEESSEEISKVIKLLIDFFAGMANSVAMFEAASNESSAVAVAVA